MRFNRRLTQKARVDMTPLVDVLFMLLLFFMMTSVFKVVPGISLALPASSTAASVSITPLRVTAVSESEIYVNSQRTSLASLDAAIRAELRGKKPTEVRAVFQGDKTVPYQVVISILDILKTNGIEGVSLLTQSRATPAGGQKK